MRKSYFLLAASALMIAACSNDESGDQSVQNPEVISLSATVNGGMRASGENLQNAQFVSGASIYVEAYKHGEGTAYDKGNYTTTNAAGTMTGSLTYPATGGNIDICAYYPSTVNSNTTTFTIQENQSSVSGYQNSDLMYATKATDLEKGSTHNLTFNHALSKIIVEIQPGAGVTAANITSLVTAVKIKNTKPTATFSIANGAVGAITKSGDITDINITGTGAINEGIIVPQEVAAGAFITVTYNGNDYPYSLTAPKTFNPGEQYTYTLTLNASGISLKSLEINDWDEGTGDTKAITL